MKLTWLCVFSRYLLSLLDNYLFIDFNVYKIRLSQSRPIKTNQDQSRPIKTVYSVTVVLYPTLYPCDYSWILMNSHVQKWIDLGYNWYDCARCDHIRTDGLKWFVWFCMIDQQDPTWDRMWYWIIWFVIYKDFIQIQSRVVMLPTLYRPHHHSRPVSILSGTLFKLPWIRSRKSYR